MKYILLLLLFLFSLIGNTQQRKVLYKGDSVYVYPYYYDKPVSYKTRYPRTHNTKDVISFNEEELMPYPHKLKDGKYIAYKEPYSYRKFKFFKLKKIRVMDSTRVAVEFNIKNGVKDGQAIYYSSSSDTSSTGNYKNDLKEGEWIVKSKYRGKKLEGNFSEYLSEKIKLNFKNGIVNGPINIYYRTGELYVTGEIENNVAVNNWKVFYENGNLKFKCTYADTLINTFKDTVYFYQNRGTVYRGTPDVDVRYNSSLIDGFEGSIYEYHRNGQLKQKRDYKYGILVKEYPIYDDKGIQKYKVENVTIDDLPMVKVTRNTENIYNERIYYKRDLYSEFVYNDSTNDTLTFKFGELHIDKFKGMDTLILRSKNYLRLEFVHPLSGMVLERNYGNVKVKKDYIEYLKDDFAFDYNKETNTTKYQLIEHDKTNRIKVVSYRTRVFTDEELSFKPRVIIGGRSVSDSNDSISFFLDGKRYTGSYENKKYRTKNGSSDNYVITKKGIVEYDYTYKHSDRYGYGGVSFLVPEKELSNLGSIKVKKRFKIKKPFYHEKGEYVNGKCEGEWVKKSNNSFKYLTNYKKGEKDGRALRFLYKRLNYAEKVDRKEQGLKKKFWYLANDENYNSGNYEGEQRYYFYTGKPEIIENYKDGKYHGLYIKYDEFNRVTDSINYVNDSISGLRLKWGMGEKEKEATYVNGVINGKYIDYSYGEIYNEGEVVNGYKVGVWKKYYDSGELKNTSFYLLKDSITIYWSGKGATKLSRSSGSDYCDYKSFYKTGDLSMKGKIEAGRRVGNWKFYDEGGNLIKEIDYKNEVIKDGWIADSIKVKGRYKEWYFTGQLKAVGYVVKESSKFDCYQKTKLKMQDVVFKEFYDINGNQLVNNGTGTIDSKYIDGTLESKGEIIQGIRSGLWNYYTPDGNLTEIGSYKQGVKDGKWLKGDLRGISFVDGACYGEDEELVKHQKTLDSKNLEIEEKYYLKGRLIKSISYRQRLK